jgi:hypothetical protein
VEKILEPEDVELLQPGHEPEPVADRTGPERVAGGDAIPAGIDHDVDVGSGFLAGGSDQGDVEIEIVAENAPAELDRLEAVLQVLVDRCAHGIGGGPEQGGGIALDPIAIRGAEELVDRLAEGLAGDVPERDVCPGEHVHPGALATVVGHVAIRLLPEPLAFERIFANQGCLQRLEADGPAGRRVDDGVTGVRLGFDVRPAGDAFVGADFQQGNKADAVSLAGVGRIAVILAGIEDHGFDVGDFHE